MYAPFVTDATSAIQLIMFLSCTIMGLSHIMQPRMWEEYFTRLHADGETAIITRTFTLELWPALLIVTLHHVWSGPGIVLTLYGIALTIKCTISVLAPQIGMRSLKQAQRGGNAFIFAGLMLIGVGACAGSALLS